MVYGDVYMLEGEAKEWKVLPSMPKPISHIEFAWQVVNGSIIIAGGTTEKNPVTKRITLVGDVVEFNLSTLVALPLYKSLSHKQTHTCTQEGLQ